MKILFLLLLESVFGVPELSAPLLGDMLSRGSGVWTWEDVVDDAASRILGTYGLSFEFRILSFTLNY